MTNVHSAVRHRELCKTDFDLHAVPATSTMTHSVLSPRRMAKSGGARRGLLMLVRNSTTAEQADLCVKVRTKFIAHDRFRKCFFKSSSLVVRKGGARET